MSVNFREFIHPSQEIRDAVNDLLIYHQLCNKEAVELYVKWKDKNYYKGDFFAYVAMSDIKELLELSQGKPWEWLIKSIYLTKNYSTKIDLKNVHVLSSQDQLEVMQIITKGMQAYEKLSAWLAPIATAKDTLTAIYDAVKVKIGIGRYVQFQILKLAEIKSESPTDEAIGLFPEFLEIENPEDIVWYFQTRKTVPEDCLILTFTRHKKYDFKPMVNMFLIWKNIMYIIESSERRLNLDNTAGQRRPDRYLEGKFEHVWLPFDVILNEKKDTSETALMVRNKRIYRRGALADIFKESPEIALWLNMFLYRVIDYIKLPPQPIEEGVTPNMTLKMLEDLNSKPMPIRIKSQSQSDASSYIVRKYGSQIKALAINTAGLEMMVGTVEHIQAVVEYERRKTFAKELEKRMLEDYQAHAQEVINWFAAFLCKRDVKKIVIQAVEDRAYNRMFYNEAFGGWYIDGKRYEHEQVKDKDGVFDHPTKRWVYQDRTGEHLYLVNGKPFTGKSMAGIHPERILTIEVDRKDVNFAIDKENKHEINLAGIKQATTNAWKYDYAPLDTCPVCNHFPSMHVITLTFKDYRQICQFFHVKPKSLRHEIVEHLHQQNSSYVGNSILDDTDPVDEITDPWFKGHQYHTIEVNIGICGHCLHKYGKKFKIVTKRTKEAGYQRARVRRVIQEIQNSDTTQ